METKYKVSEGTSAALGALRSLNTAKDAILDALTILYGEAEAQKLFEELPLDEVEACVRRCLLLSITDNLSIIQGETATI